MKSTRILTILVLALAIIVCLTRVSEAAPMGTAFTHQGRLIDADIAADGLYDFQFKLYDANVGGNQVGPDVNVPDVDVIDGYFTVELDFGSVFDGEARWLEIGVRPGELEDPSVYTTLSPRVELTPTPYAIYAQSAEDADTLDGQHAGSFLGPGSDYGRSGVSSILYEGTTALVNKYLGRTATATNADRLDGQHGSYYQSASNIYTGTLNYARYSARGDLASEGYLGNASGDLAQNNGVLQGNLNADMVDGQHASSFLGTGSDYGRSGVSSILYEGTTALVNKYLGISATAVNADRLDGQHGSYYQSASNINSGTLNNARFSARSDLSSEGYLGNASGDIAQNNGVLQVNLNADMVDGQHASSFLGTGSDYGRYGVSSTLYEGTTALVNKYLGKTATATNADKLDGQHGSYYRNATNLNAGTISESRLPQNAIDSSEIQNGSVTASDLVDGTALGEILDDDGSGSGLDADKLDGYHATNLPYAGGNGNVSNVLIGKIYQTSSGIIVSTYNNYMNVFWDESAAQIRINNGSTDWCDWWWQAQKGSTTSGNSGATPKATGAPIITGTNSNGYGFEVHFGQADGTNGWCSVWLQYSNGRMVGHYIKY